MPQMRHCIITLAFAGTALLVCTIAAIAQTVDRSADVKAMGACSACILTGQDFADRKLTGIDFDSARLSDVVFDRAALNIAVFDGAILRGVSFDGADLKGASFVGAQLYNVTFEGTDLGGAVFEGAVLEETDLQSGRLCNTQVPGDIMDNSGCE
ncbi:MAG: pentapeptide repeat-containing protein [Sulfitobacter sp.]